ncbi:MAG TPA: amino acid adenylation domain-containing protein [Thermoanaerobaculia bacterium]
MTALAPEVFRLSPQQRYLWSLGRVDGGQAYRVVGAIEIGGDLDRQALAAALAATVERHEILRTCYQCVSGLKVPGQVIRDRCAPACAERDLTDRAEAQQEAELEAIFEELRQRPFDLEQGPPLHLCLARLAPQRWVLTLALPGLSADGAALDLLARELNRCYAAHLASEDVADEPIQYADLAEWQNGLLEVEDTEEGRSYWRQWDLSSLSALALPMAARHDGGHEFAPCSLAFRIEPAAVRALEDWAAPRSASLATCLLAAWQALLGRLMERSEVVVGAACDGRKYLELKEALGLFAKDLPVRARLRPGLRFDELVDQVTASRCETAPWEEYFSWDLVASSGVTFFPFGYEFVEPAPETPPGDGRAFSIRRRYSCLRRFGVRLECARQGGDLSTLLRYDPALYRREDIAALGRWLACLVEQAVRDPRARLRALRYPDGELDRRPLDELNATDAEISFRGGLHQLVERQAAATPTQTAVQIGGRSLAYGELDRRANQLARHLRRRGVGPESRVAISMDRSLARTVAVLGVLKAGGAYVPLDPANPPRRLRHMLEDCGARVILVDAEGEQRLDATGYDVVALDRDAEAIAREDDTALGLEVAAAGAAYLIYTSGSTGRPKGVVVSHRAVCNRLLWSQSAYPLAESDAVLQLAPFGFDFSVWEIFAPLAAGARLILVPPDRHQDMAYLARLITEQEVSVVHFVPTMLRLFLEEPGIALCRHLRLVLSGGEALDGETARRVRSCGLDAALINQYGPTEAAIDATWWPLANDPERRPIPIGTPIANLRVYVLDAHLHPLPQELPGELCLGGTGLARGYQQDPRHTAERFIPDPFSGRRGERLYRTGDRARLARDGALDYLGRLDHQVRIHGIRIELGEIEAGLARHEAVREAVCTVREDTPGDPRLVAYLVAAPGPPPEDEALRAFLRDRLPEYEIPNAFVFLPELPLTPNLKVDRQALPAPEIGPATAYAAPRNPQEEVVARVWASVLGLERVGADDNFFQLGGHSLLAMRVVSRLREECRAEVSLPQIFETPTVAGLAASLGADSARHAAPALVPVPRDQPLPLSFAQQRLWFLQQLDPHNPTYHIPIALRLQGRLDQGALERTLSEIVRRHEVLRTTFDTVAGEPVQIVHPAAPVSLPLSDLENAAAAEEKLRDLLRDEALAPFDLRRGPLFRLRIVRLGAEDHVLATTLHHILSDAWSREVLAREIESLYAAFSRGEPSALPELPLQYADYAHWQRTWLQGDVLAEHLDYWRRQLADAPAALDLPTDRPRQAVLGYRGATWTQPLPDALAAALRSLGREHGVTFFMTLVAALQALLHRHAGQDDVLVGTPIANRDRSETAGLIGFFVNTLVLRSSLAGNPSFADLLARVREAVLGAFAHQELPFERLVEELQPRRDMSRTPFFQVMFALQNAVREPPEIEGLTLEPLKVETRTAKFDLTLSVIEKADEVLVSWEYMAGLFDPTTIRRLTDHLQRLLESLAADPRRRLGEHTVIGPAERHQALVEWRGSAGSEPPGTSVHGIFEAQAARVPDAVALAIEDRYLSYRELDLRAARLARELRARGLRPEAGVGLCAERSPELVVGVLAILKAGAAYVPLEAAHPQERLQLVLEDAGVHWVLAQPHLGQRLPISQGRILELDATAPASGEAGPGTPVSAGRLAYVLSTSGSTGRPKAVAVTHGNVVRLVRQTGFARLGEDQRFLQHAPMTFDASTFEVWGALLNGGQLRLMPPGTPTLAELAGALRRYRTTTLWLTSALVNQMVEAEPDSLCCLHQIAAGGDVLSPTHVRKALDHLAGGQVINGYGPTENTTFTTCAALTAAAQVGSSVSIGRPIAHSTVYLLDAAMRPVPMGVPGYLCTGGHGVARGYLGQPARTAERFVPDPRGGVGGGRLYHTGDLARYLADGQIEFLGRRDHQVKVRGFRIESGEIEVALSRHPAVSQAVVLPHGEGAGDKVLVGYLVPAGAAPAQDELRAFLAQRLPEYMIPTAFVWLGALPLTGNGKVDRGALAAMPWQPEERRRPYEPPRTPVEERVAAIWGEVLRRDEIGIHDDFFELGGHSLNATRVIARIRDELGAEIALRHVFERPTVAEIALAITERQAGKDAELAEMLAEIQGLSAEALEEVLQQELQRRPVAWRRRRNQDPEDST